MLCQHTATFAWDCCRTVMAKSLAVICVIVVFLLLLALSVESGGSQGKPNQHPRLSPQQQKPKQQPKPNQQPKQNQQPKPQANQPKRPGNQQKAKGPPPKVKAPDGKMVDLKAKVTAPKGLTSYKKIHISLLGTDKTVAYYGSVSSKKVQDGCALATTHGKKGMDVAMHVAGRDVTVKLLLDNIKGCPGPVGIEALLSRDGARVSDRKIMVQCPANAVKGGTCDVYMAGEDIKATWKDLKAQGQAQDEQDWNDDGEFDYDYLNDEDGGFDDFEDEEDMEGPSRSLANNLCPKCRKNCMCGANVGSNCFPGTAELQVEGKGLVRMDQLEIGDRVLSLKSNGQPYFDEVYSFGHRDFKASTPCIALTVKASDNSSRVLQLTGRHYVPVIRDGSSLLTYALEVEVGEIVTVLSSEVPMRGQVTAKRVIMKKGLFNPFTKDGYLVVNGVLTSTHSDWVLDYLVPATWRRTLPFIYQGLFRPLYWFYRLAGPDLTLKLNEQFVVPLADNRVATVWLAALSTVAAMSWLGVRGVRPLYKLCC